MTGKMAEEVVNEYYMHEDEPFYLIRFLHNGTRYLIGKDIRESAGVVQLRKHKGYSQPSEEILKQHFGVE